jgi:glycosyltransferase involved in cell wall biosynthesis
MKISALISVYNKDNPEYFKYALESLNNQTLKLGEIVLVNDGPLNNKLEAIIKNFIKNSEIRVNRVPLTKNVGLGAALNEGIVKCKYSWILRMDSDDISHKDRLEKLVSELKSNPNIDVLGSHIEEIDEESNDHISYRKVKLDHSNILKDMKIRNPMNHVSVIFKKKSVIDSGRYPSFISFEDYALWSKMIGKGFIFKNLDECLVSVRVGRNMLNRRRGFFYMKQEFLMQKKLYENNIINYFEFTRNMFMRVVIRIFPNFVLKMLYKISRNYAR